MVAARASALAVGALFAAIAALVSPPSVGAAPAGPAAPAAATASLSDTTPDPGQLVTVRASELLPGTPAVIDYVPDSVRFGVFDVAGDGTLVREVRIPANTYDGAKQIIITSRDATGHVVRLKLDLTIAGPPATVSLSDDSWTPGQQITFSGVRWFAGSPFAVVLYPEGAVIAQTTIGSDLRLAVTGRVPADVRNGKHGLIVAGRAATGKAAFFKIFVTVIGGVGSVGPGDPFAGAVNPIDPSIPIPPDITTPSTSSTSVLRSTPREEDGAEVDSGGISLWMIVLVALAVLLLIGVAVTWLGTTDGRAWRAKRRERKKQRRRRRSFRA
jgi:hypothetical protein